MSYTVRLTNGTTLVEIADQTINTTDTPLALVGRGAVNYGQAFAENFVHMLENFANTTAPTRPLKGQLWYDSTGGVMRYYDGAAWKVFGGAAQGNTGNVGGGLTIGGSVSSGNRTAGSTGVSLTFGSASTTVGLTLSEGKIISCTCSEDLPFASLPAQITIDTQTYVFAARFPNGLKAGVTLATDTVPYVFAGTASSAQYADLAERYATSEPVAPGDVVEIGGSAEIRKVVREYSRDVFGVISTNPAYRMNEGAGNDTTHPFVALQGRVPCKVLGTVRKGQRLVASGVAGVAMAASDDVHPQAVVGRALADKYDNDIGLVEIVLGGVK